MVYSFPQALGQDLPVEVGAPLGELANSSALFYLATSLAASVTKRQGQIKGMWENWSRKRYLNLQQFKKRSQSSTTKEGYAPALKIFYRKMAKKSVIWCQQLR